MIVPEMSYVYTEQKLYATMREVEGGIVRINEHLESQQRLNTIRCQWQQLARLIERMLMLFFIVATLVFAGVVLSNIPERRTITADGMDSKQTH